MGSRSLCRTFPVNQDGRGPFNLLDMPHRSPIRPRLRTTTLMEWPAADLQDDQGFTEVGTPRRTRRIDDHASTVELVPVCMPTGAGSSGPVRRRHRRHRRRNPLNTLGYLLLTLSFSALVAGLIWYLVQVQAIQERGAIFSGRQPTSAIARLTGY